MVVAATLPELSEWTLYSYSFGKRKSTFDIHLS